MTDALRLEVYPFGIDVVLIEPGYIPTAMEQTAVELGSSYRENLEHGPYAKVYRNFIRAWRRGTSGTRTTAEDCARRDLAGGSRNTAAHALHGHARVAAHAVGQEAAARNGCVTG